MATKEHKELKPFTKREIAVANPVIRVMSRLNTWIYRLSGGRIGGTWMYGAPILLLIVTGRKTGRRLTFPLLYLRDGDDVLVVASKGGMDTHPLWYLNLEANPDVEIEIGRDTFTVRARTASKEEKATYWPKLVAMYPDYDDYQARTERDIPVVVLSPR